MDQIDYIEFKHKTGRFNSLSILGLINATYLTAKLPKCTLAQEEGRKLIQLRAEAALVPLALPL